MSTILLAAACLCALCLTLQANDDDCDHPPVHEVVPGKEHDYIRSVSAPSLYDCAAECQLSPQCRFFIFDPEKRACQLLRKTNPIFTVGSGIFFSNIQEWKMPLTGTCGNASCGPNSLCTVGRNGNPLCSSYIDNRNKLTTLVTCTRDDDCYVTMTSCFLGRCLCQPGYSHNITSNSCDRDCERYGDTMTPYKGLGIIRHNSKTIHLTPFGDVEDQMLTCMSACVQESSFICKTVDFGAIPALCHLSREGYLDVPPTYRDRGQDNWWFAVRKCH